MRKKVKSGRGARLLSLLLCLAMTAGLLPAVAPAARAEESWVQPYLDKLVDWGVMRGDQAGNLDPDRSISRAEFISMINRAYGYNQAGTTPFDDVPVSAWYYDDIGIAYRAGYFSGTAEKLASPEQLLTREQAIVILSRNLMLQPGLGEALGFTDTRDLSDWSRGLVKTATDYGLAKGYPDGSFRPQNNITRGEVASLLCASIGTPINKPGTYSLGYTYGNVTLTASGTVLKDTVIAGDLYLTGGVGQGFVTLENVTVLGKIIASGSGESNKGDSSVILRNVSSPQMIVDTPGNQFVTIRSEGETQIGHVSVRTPSYLEDTTGEGLGLKYIELGGEAGTVLQVAGNIKEIVNITPNGRVVVARGSANLVTVDEKALGGTVTVEQGGLIKDLRLDVATNVTGKGDLEKVTISAGGSNVTMMPDSVTIRPGLTANVAGETMNTVTADEASMSPHLLAGSPRAYDVAPTAAGFSVGANKTGTVYWAVSALSDGSVGEDQLISPTSYGSKIIKNGSVKITDAAQEVTAKADGLTSAGSYYLSAVLVDSRGQRSPVKVTSFGTPDDSVPAFATGYPYMSRIENTAAQVTVMTTKSCRLYYALLPKGAAAPKPADFKAAAITGNLGYGSLDVTKSETYPVKVNSKALDELKSYDLYLWLNDVDGAKDSAVTKLSFTTVDMTPPKFADPRVVKELVTSVDVSSSIDEDGTLFWVVVKAGAEYPKPLAGSGVSGVLPLTDLAAKIQVANGSGAFKAGKVTMTANKDTTFNISGLEKEASYDLYVVAQDKAGNFADAVKKLTINTLDETAPTATLSFTKFNGNDKTTPTAETDIEILFSERVQEYSTELNRPKLDELYDKVTKTTGNEQTAAKAELGRVLESIFLFYDITDGNSTPVAVRRGTEADWVVDYREARVILENGRTKIILPNLTGLNLRSGSSYQIRLQGLCDSSRNIAGTITFPNFTTVFALVNLKETNVKEILTGPGAADKKNLHLSFEMTPVGTSKVADSVDWDMILWADTSIRFTLYAKAPTDEYWGSLGSGKVIIAGDGVKPIGVSVTQQIKNQLTDFDRLNTLTSGKTYQYGLVIDEIEGSSESTKWNRVVGMRVNAVAGSSAKLGLLAGQNLTSAWWNQIVTQEKSVTSIGSVVETGSSAVQDTLVLRKAFSDTEPPEFAGGRPTFEPTDLNMTMRLTLDRTGTIYYVIAPFGSIITKQGPAPGTDVVWANLPTSGADTTHTMPSLLTPGYQDIVMNKYTGSNPNIKWGTVNGGPSEVAVRVDGLLANTKYIAYFVTKGSSAYNEEVQSYAFETKKVVRPILTMNGSDPDVLVSADRQTALEYMFFLDSGNPPGILKDLMSGYVEPALAAEWTTAGYPATYTVLDALTNDIKEGNRITGSVFDYYADDTAKKSVATLIRNQGTGGIAITTGKINLVANETKRIELSRYMDPGPWYCLLAVGKSTAGEGSGDAFRGYRPIQQVDTTPPLVTDSIAMLEYLDPGDWGKGYKGTLTLIFSEPLYYGTRDPQNPTVMQKTQQVVGAYKGADGSPTQSGSLAEREKKILISGIFDNLPAGINIVKPSTADMGDTTVVTLDLQNVKLGATFTISRNVCDVNGRSHNEALTGVLVAGENGAMPYFRLTKVWDATGKN